LRVSSQKQGPHNPFGLNNFAEMCEKGLHCGVIGLPSVGVGEGWSNSTDVTEGSAIPLVRNPGYLCWAIDHNA